MRGEALRTLVLTDAEIASVRTDAELATALDPAVGTAPRAVLALAEDIRTAPLRPLLVSGRGLRCAPQDADVLLEALKEAAVDRFTLPEWEAEVDGLLVTLRSSGARLACLCSSDAVYAHEAADAAKALAAAGVPVYLAGRPGEREQALRAAGITNFIFAGCDALAALRTAHGLIAS